MEIDRTSWWWQKGRLAALTVVTLLTAGWLSAPLQERPWAEMRAHQPELNLKDVTENLSQGAVLGLLGGFRAIIADFLWLRGYTYWEQRDLPNMLAILNVALTIDPSSVYFWSDASNKVGYDAPAWLARALPDRSDPAAVAAVYREQTQRAIEILDRGLKFNPGSYRLLFDKALIYQNQYNRARQFHDPAARQYLEQAAEQYRLIASKSESPFFTGRIYARLLRQLGREKEAYDYMRNLYPTLSNDIVEARKVDVWETLLELENELNIPADERIPLSEAPPGWKPEPQTTEPGTVP